MHTQLRETAVELAEVLWREHTVYRDRAGGVVIRGEHVQRWISLAPSGGRDEVLVRVGRILHGGTTAPARAESVVSLGAGKGELAAVCRRLLAEAAADAAPPGTPRGRSRPGGRGPRERRIRSHRSGRARHTGLAAWTVILGITGLVALYVYNVAGAHR
ncbi:hypothetical protein [Streptomyces sp. NPDC059176]|uniref:hypothetical protein n=1 Tax=Streptomyces sp. NPDC059176 TaxID=3346758 RepID=UPI003692B9FC